MKAYLVALILAVPSLGLGAGGVSSQCLKLSGTVVFKHRGKGVMGSHREQTMRLNFIPDSLYVQYFTDMTNGTKTIDPRTHVYSLVTKGLAPLRSNCRIKPELCAQLIRLEDLEKLDLANERLLQNTQENKFAINCAQTRLVEYMKQLNQMIAQQGGRGQPIPNNIPSLLPPSPPPPTKPPVAAPPVKPGSPAVCGGDGSAIPRSLDARVEIWDVVPYTVPGPSDYVYQGINRPSSGRPAIFQFDGAIFLGDPAWKKVYIIDLNKFYQGQYFYHTRFVKVFRSLLDSLGCQKRSLPDWMNKPKGDYE